MRTSLRAKNRRPTHPGAVLREDILPKLNITLGELAERLKISRRAISNILHEHRPIKPDMALRLARFLGTTPTVWLNMQQALDIWELKHKKIKIYERIEKLT